MPSQPENCLFCRLVTEGDHVRAADGFVAIRDINPIAETHLLVLPERHVDTFRDIDAFPDDEAGRMLRFVADTASAAGLDDYKVLVNVGEGGGQTVFHLHWHVLGGRFDAGKLARVLELERRMSLIARIEEELKAARLARDEDRRDALSLVLNALQGSEEGAPARALGRRGAAGAAAGAQAASRGGRGVPRRGPRGAGRRRGVRARDPRGVHARADVGGGDRGDHRRRDLRGRATSIRDMGRVMAGVMHQVSGRADGSTVSQLVKEKLA